MTVAYSLVIGLIHIVVISSSSEIGIPEENAVLHPKSTRACSFLAPHNPCNVEISSSYSGIGWEPEDHCPGKDEQDCMYLRKESIHSRRPVIIKSQLNVTFSKLVDENSAVSVPYFIDPDSGIVFFSISLYCNEQLVDFQTPKTKAEWGSVTFPWPHKEMDDFDRFNNYTIQVEGDFRIKRSLRRKRSLEGDIRTKRSSTVHLGPPEIVQGIGPSSIPCPNSYCSDGSQCSIRKIREQSNSECRLGYTPYMGLCVKISNEDLTALEAYDYCNSHMGQTPIPDADECTFAVLQAFLPNTNRDLSQGAWMGNAEDNSGTCDAWNPSNNFSAPEKSECSSRKKAFCFHETGRPGHRCICKNPKRSKNLSPVLNMFEVPHQISPRMLMAVTPEADVRKKSCPARQHRGISWPETEAGERGSVSCPGTAAGTAYWFCDPVTSEFADEGPDLSDCRALDLQKIINQSNAIPSQELLQTLKETITHTDNLHGGDVKDVVQLLGVVTSGLQENSTTNATNSILPTAVETADAILSSDFIHSWEDLPPGLRAQTATKLTQEMDDMGKAALTQETSSGSPDGKTFSGLGGNLEMRVERIKPGANRLQYISSLAEGETFQIPEAAFSDSEESVGVSIIWYRTLGEIMMAAQPRKQDDWSRVSTVVGVKTYTNGRKPPNYATHPVKMSFERPPSKCISQPSCVYWNTASLTWSSEGCRVSNESTEHITICECSHLTNFASLADVMDSGIGQDLILTGLSLFGNILSAVCLLFVLIRILSGSQKHTVSEATRFLHANLSLSLLLANLSTVVVTAYDLATKNDRLCGRTEDEDACLGLAFLTHYFYLCSLMWMFLEGAQIYRKLVRVIAPEQEHRIFYLFIGYCFPAVNIAFVSSLRFWDHTKIQASTSECWISSGSRIIQIYSFLVPLAVVLIHNLWVLFSFHSKSTPKGKITGNGIPKTSTTEVKSLVLKTITLSPLLGLSWVFGVLQAVHFVFAYLFVMTSSLQGLFIFLLYFSPRQRTQRYPVRDLSENKQLRWRNIYMNIPVRESESAYKKNIIRHCSESPLKIDNFKQGHKKTGYCNSFTDSNERLITVSNECLSTKASTKTKAFLWSVH